MTDGTPGLCGSTLPRRPRRQRHRDGRLFNWHYPSQPILAHLTVKAIGPGGTAEQTVGVYHPDPVEQP